MIIIDMIPGDYSIAMTILSDINHSNVYSLMDLQIDSQFL